MNATNIDPVPSGHRFDVVWRGYHRRQVREYIDDEMAVMAADRDAAVEMACHLATLVDEFRSEILRLRARYDRLCCSPLDLGIVDERVQRLVQLSQAEASDIVFRARARAEHIRVFAAEERARADADADQRRRRAEGDFQLALAARRRETERSLREYAAACRTEADQRLADARLAAAAEIASARSQVDALYDVQKRLTHRLRAVRGLFLRTCALVDPVSGDGDDGQAFSSSPVMGYSIGSPVDDEFRPPNGDHRHARDRKV